MLTICPAHLRYQHLLLPNRSHVECLCFVYVNPGPRFLATLVESPSCVIPLLDCLEPPHCPVPRPDFIHRGIKQSCSFHSFPVRPLSPVRLSILRFLRRPLFWLRVCLPLLVCLISVLSISLDLWLQFCLPLLHLCISDSWFWLFDYPFATRFCLNISWLRTLVWIKIKG